MRTIGIFQSTPSVGRATFAHLYLSTYISISIHALRGEGDINCKISNINRYRFQSTPSVGRATRNFRKRPCQDDYFNPRPPWGGRQPPLSTFCKVTEISIHALRGEGDAITTKPKQRRANFNPRPPWGGRRLLIYI